MLTLWGYVKRFGAWIAANPLFALIGGLALSLMAALAGGRWKDRKLARAEAGAQKAWVDAQGEAARVETAVIEDRLATEEKAATEAHRRADDAAARQEAIEAESHERAKRWPTKLPVVILAAIYSGIIPSFGAETTQPPAGQCLTDADMTGLLAALEETASRLTGLDALAVSDGAAEIRTRIRARVEMCARITEAEIEIHSLRATIAHKDRLLEIERGNVATYRAEWESVLQKPRSSGRGPLGWTVGAGACVDADGQISLCGAGVFGWRF